MSPQGQNRYKEIKDWLRIISPYGAVFIAVFKFGGWYQDFKTHAQKWDGYDSSIQYLVKQQKGHEESDERIHAEIWRDQADFKKDVNDKLLMFLENK